MSASILRAAARGPATTFFRANPVRPTTSAAVASALHARTTVAAAVMVPSVSFSAAARLRSEHHEESFEEFTAR